MKEIVNDLKFIWKYSKKEKKYIYLYIGLNLLSLVFSVILPILSAYVIIELTNNNYMRIILMASVIFLVNFMYNFTFYISRRCSLRVYRETIKELDIDLGKNILRLENDSLEKNGSGVFIQRMTNDTYRLSNVLSSLIGVFSRLINHIGVLVAIFVVNKIVFIYIFLMLIILYCIEKIKTNVYNNDDKIYRTSLEKVSGFISELIRGSRDIKMLNSEDDFIKELSNKIEDSTSKNYKMEKTSKTYSLLMWQIGDLSSFLLIILLIILIKNEVIVTTMALVLYNYANFLDGSVYTIGDILMNIKDFKLSSERIQKILNGDEFKKETFGNIHIDKVKGNFEFDNVSFSYSDKKVLDNLSFKIKANETVAFVGKSGSGKTTIFNLLCKMYEVNSGSIKIDGIDIKELDKDSIRGNITIISQDPYIFNLSIKDNLRLVKSNLTDEEMKRACHLACLDDFINDLPNGYDTIIGEGGVNLSGGQKQRLAIARALVQKTEIILFDEATSSLDNETQEKIQEAINNMKNKYTILIIAHRLSTIVNSDRILYLENGKIEAEGTHNKLIKTCIKYKNLYESEISKDK